ncbi:hypothetical protein DSC45_20835 [Streptomyces sp. YIM 130001]|uniref:hypothetical protein n=1 Tax=Streptomyces sp. YIM 130001 TaxID=2259644 RepID=UPI000EE2ABBE|nr:hypothetical protein [Streptomyces sp. YIM 130001]RII14804.1 hypothetical protein DSC45_20835 [Streptomyces sp. YIM 130001]
MARSRPRRIRAGAPDHRTGPPGPVIDGLSARATNEITRLEHDRNYLRPGDVRAAARLWKDYVRRPERQLWQDHERGDVHWYCCGDPFEARALLDVVLQALSPRSARELRSVVSRSDAVWDVPSPPCGRGS